MTFVWLAVALAFAVAEMLTLAFYAVFLVIGGLAAAVAALLGVSQVGQVVVFCVVSIAGVLAARPPLMGYLNRNRPPETRSGAQAMIGQQAPVIEEIQPHQPGHVRIAGESWPAISADGSTIPVGSTVMVDGLHQATLVVSLARSATPTPTAPTEPTASAGPTAFTESAVPAAPIESAVPTAPAAPSAPAETTPTAESTTEG
jgi:membrane protein implicated in regulation of membrane protease activity